VLKSQERLKEVAITAEDQQRSIDVPVPGTCVYRGRVVCATIFSGTLQSPLSDGTQSALVRIFRETQSRSAAAEREAAVQRNVRDVLPSISQFACSPLETHAFEHFTWADTSGSPK